VALVPPLVAPLGVTFQLPLIWHWRRDVLGLSKPLLSFFLKLLSYPARTIFVMGVVGKGSPSSPEKNSKLPDAFRPSVTAKAMGLILSLFNVASA